MFCARCGRQFGPREWWTRTVLPGSAVPVPTCWDDRTCKPTQAGDRMQRVREIAQRYVMKGVS